MKNLVFLYVTNSSIENAKNLAKHLLEKRLIGCANIFPINSMYWWNDKIESADEVVLIAKTTVEKAELAQNEIESIHPYDIPCVIKLNADPNDKYLEWIKEQLK